MLYKLKFVPMDPEIIVFIRIDIYCIETTKLRHFSISTKK
jgi:hypothetical protein